MRRIPSINRTYLTLLLRRDELDIWLRQGNKKYTRILEDKVVRNGHTED
jgi:hypothetical protein